LEKWRFISLASIQHCEVTLFGKLLFLNYLSDFQFSVSEYFLKGNTFVFLIVCVSPQYFIMRSCDLPAISPFYMQANSCHQKLL
jgi:hypothetical protein